MDVYQHDGAEMFRFVLRGELAGAGVTNLEHAWNTAQSTLTGRDLVVDVSGITSADPSGFDLLHSMRESGARLIATPPLQSESFIRSLGLPVATGHVRRQNTFAGTVLRLVRLLG